MSRILLVTGASSDVGNALIRRVSADYDKVLCHYGHSAAKTDALRDEFGDKLCCLQADFAAPEQVERMAKEIIESGLMPSHFVHLPAIPNTNVKFSKTKWGEYEAQIAVQVHSAYILCREFLPFMAKRKYGKVVFMLTESVANNVVGKFAVPYTTAKFALYGLMKCLSAEYSDKGLTINAISPSMIDTAFVSALPEITRQINAENSPQKRNLTVHDVVPAIDFLLSSGSDMITGQNFAITGGK